MKNTLILLLLIVLAGCKDKEPTREYDLYLVGFDKPEAKGVAYWKNFEEFPLDDSGGEIQVNGMLLDGEDIYIYGLQLPPNRPQVATYWKNGTSVQLSNGEIKGMAISGSDVYAVGYQTADGNGAYRATYWKNGKATELPHKVHSVAEGIVVIGSDIHIIGTEDRPDTVDARYWKNEQLVSFLPKAIMSDFTSIVASGSDIYIAGYQVNDFNSSQSKAAYWKNGEEVVLGNGRTGSIAISGNDIYVAGDEYGQSIASGYWLNQSFHSIMTASSYRPYATHVVIAPNGDVIVVAWKLEPSGNRTSGSILWINDEPQSPFKGNNTTLELMDVAVKKIP